MSASSSGFPVLQVVLPKYDRPAIVALVSQWLGEAGFASTASVLEHEARHLGVAAASTDGLSRVRTWATSCMQPLVPGACSS